jgi:NADH-quinone oxidoreductase subunit A
MLGDYLPILIYLGLIVLVASAMLGLSAWVGVKRPSQEKLSPYECGIAPVGNARERFSISFYLVGMLFILFDVEAVFLYPWAVVYKSLKWAGFFEMFIYIAILGAGYLYIWKKGALDWSK